MSYFNEKVTLVNGGIQVLGEPWGRLSAVKEL